MKRYLNPEMIVEIIEIEDILTLSTVGDNVKGVNFGDFKVVDA